MKREKKMETGEFCRIWNEVAGSVEELAKLTGYTVDSARKMGADLRGKGSYMRLLPMKPGGRIGRNAGKTRGPRKAKEEKSKIVEEKPEEVAESKPKPPPVKVQPVALERLAPDQEAAIYCAATFDSFGVIEARTRQDGSIHFALRITTTRKCMVDYVYVYFGGEVIELGIDADLPAYQLSFSDQGERYRFLTAIAPYTQCNQDKMIAAQEFLETAAKMREAEKKFSAAFGS